MGEIKTKSSVFKQQMRLHQPHEDDWSTKTDVLAKIVFPSGIGTEKILVTDQLLASREVLKGGSSTETQASDPQTIINHQ